MPKINTHCVTKQADKNKGLKCVARAWGAALCMNCAGLASRVILIFTISVVYNSTSPPHVHHWDYMADSGILCQQISSPSDRTWLLSWHFLWNTSPGRAVISHDAHFLTAISWKPAAASSRRGGAKCPPFTFFLPLLQSCLEWRQCHIPPTSFATFRKTWWRHAVPISVRDEDKLISCSGIWKSPNSSSYHNNWPWQDAAVQTRLCTDIRRHLSDVQQQQQQLTTASSLLVLIASASDARVDIRQGRQLGSALKGASCLPRCLGKSVFRFPKVIDLRSKIVF